MHVVRRVDMNCIECVCYVHLCIYRLTKHDTQLIAIIARAHTAAKDNNAVLHRMLLRQQLHNA